MTHCLENTALGSSVEIFPLKCLEQQGRGKVFGRLEEKVERRNMRALAKGKISLKFLYFTFKTYPALALDIIRNLLFFSQRF